MPAPIPLIPTLVAGDSCGGFPDAVAICFKLGEPWRLAMPTSILLRTDFNATRLREMARSSRDGHQVRRLLSLAAIYEGASRSEAAAIGGVTLQIVRDWVVKFNAAGPAGLIDRKAPGSTPRLNGAQRAALAAAVENGPMPAVHGVVRWRIVDLCAWVWQEFRISVAPQTLSRELRAMGFRRLSARPRHHAQAPGVIEAFKKTSPRRWMRSRPREASPATPSMSGSPTKPESAGRTKPPGAGRVAAAGPRHPPTSAPHRPTSSAPSAPRKARPPA